MLTPKFLNKISDELFDKHSLGALIIVIDAGHELNIYYNNILYGITWQKGALILSGSDVEAVQEFKNCTELVINAKINEENFMDIWDNIVLDNLM